MPIRDIVVIGFILYAVPHVIRKPWLGILLWSWISYMYPHRLCWSFAFDAPVAQIAAGAMFLGMFMTREKLRLPRHPLIVVWVLFIIWMNVTTVFSLNPAYSYGEWERAMKIQLVTFCTLALINDRRRIVALVAVIAFSIGFYGIKGGLFAIRTGMSGTVWGPPGSFIAGNNEIGLALLLVLPMLRFIQLQLQKSWQRIAMYGAIVLCMLSTISTYSRGAFLAMGIAGVVLIVKSRQRSILILIFAAAIPVIIATAPEQWFNRMSSIENFEEDESAQGRINAWTFAYNLATDRPLVGGGFNAFTPELFRRYAPKPEDHHDAHSIYFEVLGEMGFVGLFLFLALFISAYFVAGRTARRARRLRELQWAADLCLMLQVSLVCYGAGGAFLGLAYFDLPYHIVAIVLLTQQCVNAKLREAGRSPTAPAWQPAGAAPAPGAGTPIRA